MSQLLEAIKDKLTGHHDPNDEGHSHSSDDSSGGNSGEEKAAETPTQRHQRPNDSSDTHAAHHGERGTHLPTLASQALLPHGSGVATSVTGCPFADITHALNIGGHVLASDTMLMEKQQTFNRSKICERMVHPCGAGVSGYFEVTHEVKDLTCASFLAGVGKRTPIFGRFSTTTFGREFPDSGRNPRGFAVKFYTDDGNYDMVGLHFPIFFVRDPSLGPDLIRSQQRNPANFLLDLDAMFDFFAGVPESLHCGTMMFSDYGTPYGFRQMNAFGCHTFKWVNQHGQETYVKYHFRSENGKSNFSWPEAIKMCGEDPDFAKRDLYSHIEKGGRACWKFCIQTMTADQIDALDFDPFDVTKIWPHSQFPLREVGRLVFDRNPESYHRDVEQVAFSPGSLVRGIELSPDILLQWRAFFYRDAQYYRLGVNLHQIPINCPLRASKYHPIARDGRLRSDANATNDPQYALNYQNRPSIGEGSYHHGGIPMNGYITRARAYKGRASTTPIPTGGDGCSGEYHDMDPDEEYRQVRRLYRDVMNDKQRDHLYFNIADQLKLCCPAVQQRFLAAIYKIDKDYAMGVVAKMEAATSGHIRYDSNHIARIAERMPCHRPYDGCPVAPGHHVSTGDTTKVSQQATAGAPVEHRAGYGDYGGAILGAVAAGGTVTATKPTTTKGEGTHELPHHERSDVVIGKGGDIDRGTTTPHAPTHDKFAAPSTRDVLDRDKDTHDVHGGDEPKSGSGIAAAVSHAASSVVAAGQRLLGHEPESKYTGGGGGGSGSGKGDGDGASGVGGGKLIASPQIQPKQQQQQEVHHYPRELRGAQRIKAGHIAYDPYGRVDEQQEAFEPHMYNLPNKYDIISGGTIKQQQPQQQQQRQYQSYDKQPYEKQSQQQTQQQRQQRPPPYEAEQYDQYSSRGRSRERERMHDQQQQGGYGSGQQQQYGYQASLSPPHHELGTGAYGKQHQYQPQSKQQQQQYQYRPQQQQSSSGYGYGRQYGQPGGGQDEWQSPQFPSYADVGIGDRVGQQQRPLYDKGYYYDRGSGSGPVSRGRYDGNISQQGIPPVAQPVREYRVPGGGSYTLGGIPSLPSFERSGADVVPPRYYGASGGSGDYNNRHHDAAMAPIYRTGPYYEYGTHHDTSQQPQQYPLSSPQFEREIERAGDALHRHYSDDRYHHDHTSQHEPLSYRYNRGAGQGTSTGAAGNMRDSALAAPAPAVGSGGHARHQVHHIRFGPHDDYYFR